jgi:peptide deformylase
VAILPIYIFDQPVLRRKAKNIKQVTDEVARLAADMLETMYNASGIGLAATQVGALHRLLVVDIAEAENKSTPAPVYFLNPEIVDEEGSVVMEEGCLSLPDLRDDVERPEKIVVRYRDLEFREQELRADGLLARVVQHELDHLNGVLFFDHLNIVRRKLLQGRLNKMKRGESTVNYPAIGAIEVPRDPNAPRILND